MNVFAKIEEYKAAVAYMESLYAKGAEHVEEAHAADIEAGMISMEIEEMLVKEPNPEAEAAYYMAVFG